MAPALDPSAHIAPDSPAATLLHRAVMLARLPRARAGAGPAGAVAAALARTALDRLDEREREALAPVAARRAEIPFDMVASGRSFGFGPPPRGAEPESPGPAAEHGMSLAAARDVCRWSTIPPLWGRFLFSLVRALRPSSCVELGTGLGVSGLYQAAALALNGGGRLTTFDRDPAARIAERGFERAALAGRVRLRFGDIDETLPDAGPQLAPVDLALLDAEHSEAATIRHFDLVLPYLAEEAVVLFDDITQTAEMRRAWSAVVARREVGFNLALRRYGVAVVTPGRV